MHGRGWGTHALTRSKGYVAAAAATPPLPPATSDPRLLTDPSGPASMFCTGGMGERTAERSSVQQPQKWKEEEEERRLDLLEDGELDPVEGEEAHASNDCTHSRGIGQRRASASAQQQGGGEREREREMQQGTRDPPFPFQKARRPSRRYTEEKVRRKPCLVSAVPTCKGILNDGRAGIAFPPSQSLLPFLQQRLHPLFFLLPPSLQFHALSPALHLLSPMSPSLCLAAHPRFCTFFPVPSPPICLVLLCISFFTSTS